MKQGILSTNAASWYLAYEHDGSSMSYNSDKVDSNEITATVPLGNVLIDGGQMLLSVLDVTPTSTIYEVSFCAILSSASNPSAIN